MAMIRRLQMSHLCRDAQGVCVGAFQFCAELKTLGGGGKIGAFYLQSSIAGLEAKRRFMKINKPPTPSPVKRVREADAPRGPSSAAPVTAPDEVSFAGIPENELTPRVREALLSLMEEVRALRSELVQARAEMRDLKTLADTDPLLGVFNRRAFVAELNRTLALIERYSVPASLIFIDLNDLKKVNDEHGHTVGDQALQHVATLIAQNIRQTDVLGRLGGDELGLLLTQTEAEAARAKTDSLQAVIAATPLKSEGKEITLNIASGVVALSRDISAEEALDKADTEMYASKRQSKEAP